LSPRARLQVAADPEALAREVSAWLADRIARAGARFGISLAGGATPRRTYELLAVMTDRGGLRWDRVHWFWGDERFVPPDSSESNYRMAWDTLLSRVQPAAANVHAVPTVNLSPERAAIRYEEELQAYYGAERLDAQRPLFDVTLLGLGEDGHTASLLPGQPVLEESRHWVAAVAAGRPQARITLTYPAIESSAAVAFIVSGRAKREILAEVLQGRSSAPAAQVHPQGELIWFADRDAAGGPAPA
jgi:6-phosphogluconolactonase